MWILIAEPAEAGWMNNFGRLILSWLDKGCFVLLEFVYKVFFVVANATIFSPEFIRMFYARIQLILGVFMIFVVSFTLINYVVSPEKALDQRAGAGKFVMRIIVALFLLTLIIPINIPNVEEPAEGEAGSLNYYMNTHGILFGILYKFQDSVMRENFLGKLILGINTENSSDVTLDDLGGQISGTVARAFVRPNVIDTSEPYCEMTYDEALEQGVTDPCPNVICPTTVFTSSYDNLGLSGADIMDMVNLNCLPDNENPHWYESAGAWLMGIFGDSGKRYAFAYTPFLGAAASIIMTIIILGFTIDIAIRAIKLAVLRLIAPIPIIGYVQQPKDKGGGAFENWGRSLVSTYLDLFIRLAIIYFVLFVIRNFSTMTSFDNSTLVNSFATVFIILGMLFFAKQAPKFLKDMLGIKGNPMGNVGLSGILGGAAMAIGGGGLAGFGLGMMQGSFGEAEAVGQGKQFGPGGAWKQNRDLMARIRTGDKDARGGIIGRAMDRLNFNVRERTAEKLGIGKENIAILNQRKKDAQARAGDTAEALKMAELQAQSVGAQQHNIDLTRFTDDAGNVDIARATTAYSGRYTSEQVRQQAAYNRYMRAYQEDAAAQVALTKAAKAADNADTYAGQLGAAPDVRGFYRETYRSNKKVRTDDNKNPIDRYGNPTRRESEYTFEPDLNGGGTVDDSTWASSHGGGPGPGPGPGPGHR